MIRRLVIAAPLALVLGFAQSATAQQTPESAEEATAPAATLSAPASAPAGSKVEVTWVGPGNDPADASDFIAIAVADGKMRHRVNVIYGSPHEFDLPDQPGTYELRYVRDWEHKPTDILARQAIEVTAADAGSNADTVVATDAAKTSESDLPKASLKAPATAEAGSTIEVAWTGPDGDHDHIAVAAQGGKPIYLAETGAGSPVSLAVPPRPGAYELRYHLYEGHHILARRALEVTPVEAALDAPATAPAGSRIEIVWTGPGDGDDRISIGAADADDNPVNFNRPESDQPVTLQVPMEPGSYQLRYVLANGAVAARRAIEVTPMAPAKLDVPASAPAGSTIQIGWSGPQKLQYKQVAYIVIVKPDAGSDSYFSMHLGYGADPEISATLPGEPGAYEVRYKLASLGEVERPAIIVARKTIEVTPVKATLDVPGAAPAGSTIEVDWTGPGYEGDNIVVVQPRASGLQWIDYYQPKDDNPLKITLPDEPGTYEVRYMVNTGYPSQWTLARQTIEVEPPTAEPAAATNAEPDAAESCDASDCSRGSPAQTGAASRAAAEACDSRRCFDDRFQSCRPATYTASNPMGTAKYTILGKVEGGCRVELTFLGNPNPAWVDKPLVCTYDGSLDFRAAAMQALSSAVSGGADADCEGPLLAEF